MEATEARVEGRDGLRGTFVPPHADDSHVLVRFEGGRTFFLPAGWLERDYEGVYHLPFGREALEGAAGAAPATVIPIIEETVHVARRWVETGRVRVAKSVSEKVEDVSIPLTSEEVSVERVPVNRIVDDPLPVREEGDTVVIPILEETYVIEKRLVLKEEVRIRRRQVTREETRQIMLRKEEARVDELPVERPT